MESLDLSEGISREARDLLNLYTGWTYRLFNTILKYDKFPPNWKDHWNFTVLGDRFEMGSQAKIKAAVRAKAQIMQEAILASRTPAGPRILYRSASDRELKSVRTGQTLKASAFVSTSTSLREAVKFWDAGVGSRGTVKRVWRLILPAAAASLYVDAFSRNKGEKEVLLPYGATFTIQSIAKVEPFFEVGYWRNDHYKMSVDEAKEVKKVMQWHTRNSLHGMAVNQLVTATVTTPKVRIPLS